MKIDVVRLRGIPSSRDLTGRPSRRGSTPMDEVQLKSMQRVPAAKCSFAATWSELSSWIRTPTAIVDQPRQKQSIEPPYKPQFKNKKEWLGSRARLAARIPS